MKFVRGNLSKLGSRFFIRAFLNEKKRGCACRRLAHILKKTETEKGSLRKTFSQSAASPCTKPPKQVSRPRANRKCSVARGRSLTDFGAVCCAVFPLRATCATPGLKRNCVAGGAAACRGLQRRSDQPRRRLSLEEKNHSHKTTPQKRSRRV